MILHRFEPQVEATLLRRYKRYLADFMLPDGTVVTAHCPNPGRMTSVLEDCGRCYLTPLPRSATRKLDYRWELAESNGAFVTVNTQLANRAARTLLENCPELQQRLELKEPFRLASEVGVLSERAGTQTRFDFAFSQGDGTILYLEVKQVTLKVRDIQTAAKAAFPDAVSLRGHRHLSELTRLRREGVRTALLYMVGRPDVEAVRPAHEVDPEYARLFFEAAEAGVTMVAARLKPCPRFLSFGGWLPVEKG